jgi:uncharacterized protein YaaN involved in tellurite resistance
VESNNFELVQAVHAAANTTVAALRVAAMAAQALSSQRVLGEQLGAVNRAARALGEEAADMSAQLLPLEHAWDEVSSQLDQIDSYKLQALSAMQRTVQSLTHQLARSARTQP